MTARVRRLLASAAVVVAVGGCMYVRPAFQPGPWDMYGNAGPLKVYGARRAAAGQRIYDSLRREPELWAFFDEQGEPDTIEVVGSRWEPKRFVLTYRRDDAGRPRRIELDPSIGGYVAQTPELLRSERVVRHEEPRTAPPERARPSRKATQAVAVAPPATTVQRLECPIDRRRADCRALCVAGATHEWCR